MCSPLVKLKSWLTVMLFELCYYECAHRVRYSTQ